jgi:twitching motility protein PilU
MLKTPFIAELIEDHRISEIKDAMEQGTLAGMQTFDQSLYKLFKDGKITIDEALRNADSKNNLRLRLRLEDPEQFTSDDKLQMKEDEDLVHRIDSKKRK